MSKIAQAEARKQFAAAVSEGSYKAKHFELPEDPDFTGSSSCPITNPLAVYCEDSEYQYGFLRQLGCAYIHFETVSDDGEFVVQDYSRARIELIERLGLRSYDAFGALFSSDPVYVDHRAERYGSEYEEFSDYDEWLDFFENVFNEYE